MKTDWYGQNKWRKLCLNKRTIAHLNKFQMLTANGGALPGANVAGTVDCNNTIVLLNPTEKCTNASFCCDYDPPTTGDNGITPNESRFVKNDNVVPIKDQGTVIITSNG